MVDAAEKECQWRNWGYRGFYSTRFQVNDATLIHDGNGASVVEARLCGAVFTDRPLQVIDVGTGSGAIAISVVQIVSQQR